VWVLFSKKHIISIVYIRSAHNSSEINLLDLAYDDRRAFKVPARTDLLPRQRFHECIETHHLDVESVFPVINFRKSKSAI
jgi:hypothetical protein